MYISTVAPSGALQDLVQYVVRHYVPMWFTIHQNSSCDQGSRNLFRSVVLLRDLPQRSQAVIRPVIQRNGYWAHSEQLLLAMATDSERAVREKAVRHIGAARQLHAEEVRPFVIPVVNFDATTYTDLISWDDRLTQPPLLRDLSRSELVHLMDAPLTVPPYPVHTQAVERAVRMVTEACTTVIGDEARDGHITAKLKHRRQFPAFNSKQDILRR